MLIPTLRLARDLRRFVREPLTAGQAAAVVRETEAGREAEFLALLREAVFARPRSPYRALLEHAGFDLDRVRRLVAERGLETALDVLAEAGVRVSHHEYKRGGTIERGGLRLEVRPGDFENPLARAHGRSRSSGSSGAPTSVTTVLDHLHLEAAYVRYFLDAPELRGRAVAIWRGVPPVTSGIRLALRLAHLGRPAAVWFAQNRLPWRRDTLAPRLYLAACRAACRLHGRPGAVPAPRYVHQDEAVVVARWLAGRVAAGTPALLDTNASSGVRVALAALEHGLELAGTVLRLGGEPYTDAKRAVVERAGMRALCHYSMSETGAIALACTDPGAAPAAHVIRGLFVLRPVPAAGGAAAGAHTPLRLTALSRHAPRLLINVDTGDRGRLDREPCGCPLGALGQAWRVSEVRADAKLTSEGLSYPLEPLLEIVEEILPRRFGGHPIDYQLAESDEGGIPVVELRVSPRVGPVDEQAVVEALYERLDALPEGDLYSVFWRDARTVRVVREEPRATASAKILPLDPAR